MAVWMDMFAAAYSAGQWMLLFYLCSFAGWCWEVLLHLVRDRRVVNRGFLTGPFLPIYGFGALLVLFVCLPIAGHLWLVALAGTLAASLLEYLTGEAMEALFHVRYWDYSRNKWNLRGHICLLSVAAWAVMSVLMTCVLHPLIHPLLSRVPDVLALACGGMLTLLAAADTVLSVRGALDIRSLLSSMERRASELDALREEIHLSRERFEQRSEWLHDARMLSRMKKAQRMLRRNPSAVSLRHPIHFGRLTRQEREEQQDHTK